MRSKAHLFVTSVVTCFLIISMTAFGDLVSEVQAGMQGDPVLQKHEQMPDLVSVLELNIRGFSDFGFSVPIMDEEYSSTFTLGELDFFMTSEIGERVSFLAETVFYFSYFSPNTNRQFFTLQRASLKYSLSDILNITIGKNHTALGYWNHTFHHGSWFQTTILRPEVYRFEYEGGVLPVHSVGIELSGAKAFDALDVEYHLGVFNGRGRTSLESQFVNDLNDSKAINALLSLKPHFAKGLKLGANIYRDTIPPDPLVLTRTDEIDEQILGGHVAYIYKGTELIGEVFQIHHDDKTSGKEFDTVGYYLQASHKIKKFTPYYRFDSLDFEDGDPFFTLRNFDISIHTLGLKWDVFTWNALKLEYSASDEQDEDNEHSMRVNSSFAF